jgi:hypothetical protein
MAQKFLFCFSTLALATAFAASSYKVTLFDASTVNGKTLDPGDYKMELKDNGIVLRHGKDVTEAPATTEMNDKKYTSTKILYNANHELQQICIRGTKTKIVLNNASQSAGGGSAKTTIRAIHK